MRILLVEDDVKIASFVQKGLKSAGFAVDHAVEGETGLHLILTEPYDAAIIDVMLPKLDGLALIEKMRGTGLNTPVIVLSATGFGDCRPAVMIICPSPLPFQNCWPGCRPCCVAPVISPNPPS